MQFDPEVEKSVDLIRNVLLDLTTDRVFENGFVIFGDLTSESYADLMFRDPHERSIPINIRCSRYDVQIDLDGSPEVLEWPIGFIESRTEDFTTRIKQLLIGYVLSEKRGNNYRAFTVFDQKGHFLFTRQMINGFYYMKRPSFHLFLPYFQGNYDSSN